MPQRRTRPERPAPAWHDERLVEPPEIDEDAPAEALREAALLLDVPEWVDPETGELADDELTRLEEH